MSEIQIGQLEKRNSCRKSFSNGCEWFLPFGKWNAFNSRKRASDFGIVQTPTALAVGKEGISFSERQRKIEIPVQLY